MEEFIRSIPPMHLALLASLLVNLYLLVKRPHKHIKVKPLKGSPGVYVHTFKTKKSRNR